ncbi:hypothetical protein KCP77_03700 [Salmonella enterica subsp. enterica]|nr:hypothetical protein KCP77_03700 [Salmonella enterica subsp. enterica]
MAIAYMARGSQRRGIGLIGRVTSLVDPYARARRVEGELKRSSRCCTADTMNQLPAITRGGGASVIISDHYDWGRR